MRLAPAALALCLVAGCVSRAPEPEGPRIVGPPSYEQAQRLLGMARSLRETEGCAEAAPVYRVLAGFGEGLEPAQVELGECLLEMEGGGAQETALFRREALFWLERAAYAGDGRAQRRLAEYYAAVQTPHGDAQKALGWALLFAENGDAELYGLAGFPKTFETGLRASLSDAAIRDAEKFAEDFSIIRMAIYAPSLRAGRAARKEFRRPQSGGQGPRRR